MNLSIINGSHWKVVFPYYAIPGNQTLMGCLAHYEILKKQYPLTAISIPPENWKLNYTHDNVEFNLSPIQAYRILKLIEL
jgi:hypothetical protein